MCRIVGKVSLREESLSEELVDAGHSLKEQAKNGCIPVGAARGHKDGCGVAWIERDQIRLIRRGRTDAWDEAFVAAVRQTRCNGAIAHDRKASPQLKPENCRADHAHPFLANFGSTPIAFCHNGGIPALMDEANRANITDSQVFLKQLLKDLPALDAGSLSERVGALAQEYAATPEKYTSLTALVLSPTHLFGWRLYCPDAPSHWFDQYYTLHIKRSDDRVVVASEPLDEPTSQKDGANKSWDLLRNGTLFAINLDGGRVSVEFAEIPLRYPEVLKTP